MADQETTTVESVDTGAETAQPVEAEETTAVTEDVTEATDKVAGEEGTESSTDKPSFDEDTLAWMKNKGIDPESPEALAKATKAAREAEKAMHSKAQEKSKLEKDMLAASDETAEQRAEATGQDPELMKRLQRMEVRESMRNFWDNNQDAKKYEDEIRDVLIDKNLSGDPATMLEAAYAIVLRNHAGEVEAKGGRKALETLASKQRSTAIKGAAVNATATTAKKDAFREGFHSYKQEY